jgi:hypothetical protein
LNSTSTCSGLFTRATHIDGGVGAEIVDIYQASLNTPGVQLARWQTSGVSILNLQGTPCDDKVTSLFNHKNVS